MVSLRQVEARRGGILARACAGGEGRRQLNQPPGRPPNCLSPALRVLAFSACNLPAISRPGIAPHHSPMLRPQCLLGFHAPKRSKAYYVGVLAHAPCRGCGTTMTRKRMGWRATSPLGRPIKAIVVATALLLAAILIGVICAPRHAQLPPPVAVRAKY